MSSVKKWLEDAKAGGFDSAVLDEHLAEIKDIGFITIHNVGWIFLVPDAWQAVAKTRQHKYPRDMMLSFMTKIADGLTIEEALSKIQN